jgi:hypothetical protein
MDGNKSNKLVTDFMKFCYRFYHGRSWTYNISNKSNRKYTYTLSKLFLTNRRFNSWEIMKLIRCNL